MGTDAVTVKVLHEGATAMEFRQVLADHRPHVLVFCNAGDAASRGEQTARTFATSDGTSETLPEDSLVEILCAHSAVNHGRVKVIVLNGSCTGALGGKLSESAIAEHVICWKTQWASETQYACEAATIFGPSFLRAYLDGQSASTAFAEAKIAVRMGSTHAHLTGDQAAHKAYIDRFCLRDPCGSDDETESIAVGIPELLDSPIATLRKQNLLVRRSEIGDVQEPPLGIGAFSDVHIVTFNRKEVARKTVRADTRAKAKLDAVREANMMSGLRHANIVRLRGVCIDLGHACILMEYCERGSLRRVLENDPRLPLPRRFSLLCGAIAALQHMHKTSAQKPRATLHRDIKPANLLVTQDWVCKLGDFGTAQEEQPQQQQQVARTGTRNYLAPEITLDEQRHTVATDVYSFGLTMFEVITGGVPFSGVNDVDLVAKLHARERPDMPADCNAFFVERIQECWHQSPEDRPSSEGVLKCFCSAAVEIAEFRVQEIPVNV
jgi:hypothetical protein